MVINFPTALYSSVLPTSPSSPSDITWLISSTDPPRVATNYISIITANKFDPLPIHIFDTSTRYQGVGAYIANITYSRYATTNIGNKMFEVGQFLEFDDVTTQSVNSATVPDTIDLQQDTNVLDLSGLGLSDEDIQQFESAAWSKFNETLGLVNTTKATITSLSIAISNNQKLLNETVKAKNAATLVLGLGSEVVNKLIAKQTELTTAQNELISQLNSQTTSLNALYNQLIQMREVVR